MALTPADFTFPLGPLRPAHFPGEDLDAALEAWIADVEGRAALAGVSPSGKAARAAVLALAYRTRCEGGTGRAIKRATVDGKATVEYADGGPDFCALAARYEAEAGVLLTVDDEPEAAVPAPDFTVVRSLR